MLGKATIVQRDENIHDLIRRILAQARSLGFELDMRGLGIPAWIFDNACSRGFIEEISESSSGVPRFKLTFVEHPEDRTVQEEIFIIEREFANRNDMIYQVLTEAIRRFQDFTNK